VRLVVGLGAAVGATIESVVTSGEWLAIHIDGNRSVVFDASHRWSGEPDLEILPYRGDPTEEASAMCDLGIMNTDERAETWRENERKRTAQREADEREDYARLKAKFEDTE
jgi:hypothetical protein